MASCRALDCGKPSGRRVLCRECAKALQPGELWTLRMAAEAPLYSAWDPTLLVLEVSADDQATRVGGSGPISDVLAWLEYDLAAWACAAAITARRKAKADRKRLAELRRVTGPRRR